MESVGNMITAVNCCVGCPRQGCGAYHDKCPQYQEQAAKRKADKAGVAKQKAFYNYICEEMEKVEKKRRGRNGNFIAAIR